MTTVATLNQDMVLEHETRARSLPLSDYDVSQPEIYRSDVWMPYFKRLRQEDPVHYCKESRFGPYWSITKYDDIVDVELKHEIFSSESALGGVSIVDRPMEVRRQSFLSMDPPKHDEQRKVVQPIVAPNNLKNLATTIRERTCDVLDNLPRAVPFNWVERVSIELTTRMLATLFGFPYEDRHKLTYWSDIATLDVKSGGPIDTEEKKYAALLPFRDYLTNLWNEREKLPPQSDLLSMMSHNPAAREVTPKNFFGNLTLLLVGGNDTTRNSMSSSVWFMHLYPEQNRKLRENGALLEGMIPEVIRFHTPLLHMRRTAVADYVLRDKMIKKGDKVVMWYISGNRDEDAIERPDEFLIDRRRPRQHLSFGFGVHRCVGNRLAELQLRILWEEILARFERIEVLSPPERVYSAFVHGITNLQVRLQ